jgi:hypothetical protein
MQHLNLLLQHPINETLVTYTWNRWNIWNIHLKHTCIAIATWATSRSTSATSIWNTYNIHLKHPKHFKRYACNMRFQHNLILLLRQIEASHLVELDASAEIDTSAELGGVQPVGCLRRATPTLEKATSGGCSARDAAPLRSRKAVEEGGLDVAGRSKRCGRGATSWARTGASVTVEARDEQEQAAWTGKRGIRRVGCPEESESTRDENRWNPRFN